MCVALKKKKGKKDARKKEERKENNLADKLARAAALCSFPTLSKTSVLITWPSISVQDLLAETPKMYSRRDQTNGYINVISSGKIITYGLIQQNVCSVSMLEWTYSSFFFFFFCLFAISWATPTAYGSSQARGRIRAVAAGVHQSHSKAGSKLHLWPTPQFTATPDP